MTDSASPDQRVVDQLDRPRADVVGRSKEPKVRWADPPGAIQRRRANGHHIGLGDIPIHDAAHHRGRRVPGEHRDLDPGRPRGDVETAVVIDAELGREGHDRIARVTLDHPQLTDRGARAPDGRWIYLFRPEVISNRGADDPSFIQPARPMSAIGG